MFIYGEEFGGLSGSSFGRSFGAVADTVKSNNKKRKGSGRYNDPAECIVPCTIRMMQNAFLKKNMELGTSFGLPSSINSTTATKVDTNMTDIKSGDHFILHGKPVGAVILRGWIIDIQYLASQLQFKILDGTGILQVHFNTSASTSCHPGLSYSSLNPPLDTSSVSSPTSSSNASSSSFSSQDNSSSPNSLTFRQPYSDQIENLKEGQLISVIGTPVLNRKIPSSRINNMDSNCTKNDYEFDFVNNLEESNDELRSCCSLEACHFRHITDFCEYAYYSDIEAIHASIIMQNLGNNSKDQCVSNTISTHDPYSQSPTSAYSCLDDTNNNCKSLDDIEIPETLSHVTNILQKIILKLILSQPENKAGRISTEDIIKLIRNSYSKYSVEDIQGELDTLLDDGDIMYTHGDFVDIV